LKMKKMTLRILSLAFALTVTLGAPSTFAAATIVIQNNDAAGVGFNDPTAVAPVGGNSGTTLGQQRLIAFQQAASIWGATLTSVPVITIKAQWTALTCTATTAVLGSAGAVGINRDFAGAPFTGTWYSGALANAITGTDQDPSNPEINANFNINLGQTGCLDGTFFYLGLDAIHGTNVDLVSVLLHEFSHGLGFQTFTNGSSGAQNGGFPSIYDRFLMGVNDGKSWLQMTNAERAASAIIPHKLAWDGPQVTTDRPAATTFGVPVLTVNSPAPIAGNYTISTANFGPSIPAMPGITGNMVQAMDPADAVGPSTTDGCSAFTNAAEVAGKIAVVDRGTCTFKTKALNAQNAGAIALLIVNNVAGAPPQMADDATITTAITISSVQVTLADGNLIKAQLGTGVNATLFSDTSAGDPLGKALVYTPNPFASGSSVSHWDTIATPNLLMEPNINGDLTHIVVAPTDLTFSQLKDTGWVAGSLPNTITTTTGDNQTVVPGQQFPVPFSVTINPPIAGVTVTFTANASTGGANGTFASTSSRYATAVTNASGVATAPAFTANSTNGDYGMNATAPGAGTTAFTLHNSDGASTPTPTPVVTATPTVAPPTPSPSPVESVTPTPTPVESVTPTATPNPISQAINLSTRLVVQGGANVGIGGFIISGTDPVQVLIRGIGPSLANFGVPNPLANPALELNGANGFVTVTNNDWRDNQEAAIQATGLAPTNDLESAILATLPPGSYTAIISGQGGGTGNALIEIYDLSPTASSKLGNISTRASVGTGDGIVIAGFILGNGIGADTLVVRGIGPSLTDFGVPNALSDPNLEVRNADGVVVTSNDNWQQGAQAAEIQALGLAPTNAAESALIATLAPASYTALLSGVGSATGVGLVEVYDNPAPGGPTPTPGPTQTPGITPTPPPIGTPTPTPGVTVCTENFDGDSTGATGWLGCIKPDRWRWSAVCHHHHLIGHRT
jgi:hypothetical protein